MNYTKPNDPDHLDSTKDYLAGVLVFSKALGVILQDKEGVVINLDNDMKDYFKFDRAIVYNHEDRINIMEEHMGLLEGQRIVIS